MIITNVGHEMKWKWELQNLSRKLLQSLEKRKLWIEVKAKRIRVRVIVEQVTNKLKSSDLNVF